MTDLDSTVPEGAEGPGTPVNPAPVAPEGAAFGHPGTDAPQAAPGYPYPSFAAPVPDPEPARGRGLALRATAMVAAAVLVGVGIGFGIIKVKYDDAPAVQAAPAAPPAAAPEKPHPFGAESNGTHFGSLRDLLLPMPAGYRPGPDDGAYGNDTELDASQISTDLDAQVKDLPKDQRDHLKGTLQAIGEKGEGIRSYRPADGYMAVYLRLEQFNQQSVQAYNEIIGVLGSDSGAFRQGPTVPGHTEAHCFLPPADPSAPIDDLMCTAAVGDLLVTMHVEGVAPLPKSEAVSIFRQQLERLALPGASV